MNNRYFYLMALVLSFLLAPVSPSYAEGDAVKKAANLYVEFEYAKALHTLAPEIARNNPDAEILQGFIFSDAFGQYYDPEKQKIYLKNWRKRGTRKPY